MSISLSNFKLIDIIEIYKNSNNRSKCLFCEKNIDRISTFDKCSHYCCLDCLDSLYDFYKNDKNDKNDKNILFLCPLCKEEVCDIDYKDL